jgi:hypothetical protein
VVLSKGHLHHMSSGHWGVGSTACPNSLLPFCQLGQRAKRAPLSDGRLLCLLEVQVCDGNMETFGAFVNLRNFVWCCPSLDCVCVRDVVGIAAVATSGAKSLPTGALGRYLLAVSVGYILWDQCYDVASILKVAE